MKLMLALLALAAPPAADEIYWYFDADAALKAAEKTGRPIVVLKIRSDIGPDVKT